VLATGIAWQDLPQELGYPSGMTCWRRLRDWNDAGVFDRLHRLLLAKLHQAGQLDWSRAVIDASHVRALKGGRRRAQARSTVADRAASTTWSATLKGSRLRSA
jgi:transposase